MTPQKTLTQLGEQRLTGMAEQLSYQFDQPDTYDELGFIERLSLLINHEASTRDNRKVTRLLKQAKLRYNGHASDIDCGLHKDTLAQLLSLDWIRKSRNVLIQGPSGTGKTFLACVLGQAACEHGLSTKYIRTSRLFEALTLSHGNGSYTKLLAKNAKIKPLIIDNWGLYTSEKTRISCTASMLTKLSALPKATCISLMSLITRRPLLPPFRTIGWRVHRVYTGQSLGWTYA